MKRSREHERRVRLRRVEPALRRALRGPCRLPPESTLLVAVSGGADSTALLVALASLAHESGLRLHAAHLDHGLRGAASAADARAVRVLCESLGVPLSAARWDCRARMRARGLSGEAGLRTLRRDWLTRTARRVGAAAIATAHTADDQLETLLMRFARGSGLAGAAGMQPRLGAWIKPLLEVTRAELEADLRQHGVSWREDATNSSHEHLRNRVRHVAVPALLDALGVEAGDAVSRRARLARRAARHASELADARRVLEHMAARALARARTVVRGRGSTAAHGASSKTSYALATLARLPRAIQRLALRMAWQESGDPASPGLTFRQLTPLLAALSEPAGRTTQVALAHGWRAVNAAGVLRFEPPARRGQATGRVGARPSAGTLGGRATSRRRTAADARLLGNRKRARVGLAAGPRARRQSRRSRSHVLSPARPAGTQERS